MSVIFSAPPPPGSTQPGDLYVDLQSRSLWLGVDTAVDPSGAVLISDIEALLANDTATLGSANAYTDAGLATKAALSHTHPSAQITDFVPAVQSVVSTMPSANFIAGMIVLWPGQLVDIGVGDLAGWALCDGASLPRATYPELFSVLQTTYGSVDSTHFNLPDFRDRFIVGAGNINPGTKNTPTNFLVSAAGAHNHGATTGATALTAAMLPAHTHTFSDTFSGTTSAAGGHSHTVPINKSSASRGDTYGGFNSDEQLVNSPTSAVANHTHTFSGSVSGTTSSVGSGATHTHTIANADDHQHTVTAAQVKAALNHMAMAYIIKL